MTTDHENFQERLLAQHQPSPQLLSQYQEEVHAMLERNERGLRREKWYAPAFWIFAVLLTTSFLVLSGTRNDTSPGVLLGFFSCLLLIAAAVELLKYFMNRGRVELLKEIKGIELRLLEVRERLDG